MKSNRELGLIEKIRDISAAIAQRNLGVNVQPM